MDLRLVWAEGREINDLTDFGGVASESDAWVHSECGKDRGFVAEFEEHAVLMARRNVENPPAHHSCCSSADPAAVHHGPYRFGSR